MLIYKETESFKKDFKKLLKKYKTLEEDFKLLKIATIELYHLKSIDNNSIFLCEGLQNNNLNNKVEIYKIKKIACRSLKNFGCNTGLRIIYSYIKEQNTIEFIQIYHKNESINEDKNRIKKYLDLFMD